MLFILGMQYLYLGVLRCVLGGMPLAYSSKMSFSCALTSSARNSDPVVFCLFWNVMDNAAWKCAMVQSTHQQIMPTDTLSRVWGPTHFIGRSASFQHLPWMLKTRGCDHSTSGCTSLCFGYAPCRMVLALHGPWIRKLRSPVFVNGHKNWAPWMTELLTGWYFSQRWNIVGFQQLSIARGVV